MKKIKVLPLILALPLLVGCNKVREPRFAKLGDKIDYDSIVQALDEAKKANAFYITEENQHIPSSQTKFNLKVDGQETLKRDGKVILKEEGYSNSKATAEYNADDKVVRLVSQENAKGIEKSQTGKETNSEKNKGTRFIQKYSEEGKEYAVEADTVMKTFRIVETVEETNPYEAIFDARSMVTYSEGSYYFDYMLVNYPLSSDERKQEFSFYKNDKIFTVEMKHEETEEEKNAQEEVIKVEKSTIHVKVQIDLSKEDRARCLTYYDVEQNIEYKKDSGNYCAGDILDSKTIMAGDVRIVKKDVKISAVDLTGYKKTLQ